MPKYDADLKKAIKLEYMKCSRDPVHFMRKYCKIQHPMKGKIPFNLYPFQEDVLTEFKEHRYNIVLKSRQLGISTLCAAYALWLMLFHDDKNCLVIATDQATSKNLVTKVRTMNENLPAWLKAQVSGIIEDNKLSLKYGNGSQIKAVAATDNAGRSEALSLLIMDECAFINHAETIWTAAQSTLSTGGQAIILSTPNGVGNFFHKTWIGAKEAGFNTIKLHWSVHPDRNHQWRKEQDKILGTDQAAQECDCDFLTSGRPVVHGTILDWYQKESGYITEPLAKQGFDGNYWAWAFPDYSKQYMINADVARGDGSDYSAFHVFDLENMEQVAEYRGKIDTKNYGIMLSVAGTEWNDALVVVENANVGWAVIQQIIERGYKNLFYSYKDDGYIDPSIHLVKGYDLKSKEQMVPGFTTSSRTRPLLISKLDMVMREKLPIIRSQRLIDELFTFVWNGTRAEARSGYNDDLIMSFCIGWYLRDTALRLKQQGTELTKNTLMNIRRSTGTAFRTDTSQAHNQWNWQVGGSDENLKWLLK